MKKRSETEKKYTWDIEEMYPDEGKWDDDYKSTEISAADFKKYEGRLSEDARTLLAAFKDRDGIWRKLEKVYTYARMRKDEDNANPKYQILNDRAQMLMAKTSALTSFFTPEFLSIDDEVLKNFLKEEKGFKLYGHLIETLLREKAHVLDTKEERLLAQLGEITSASGDIFGMINNADIRFGKIKDEKGSEVELTHGNYIKFMESKDRAVRKNAFEKMYDAYMNMRNTLATTYAYNTRKDVIYSRIRSYPSSLASALSGDNVGEDVYNNLIEIVNKNLPVLHRYMDIRKKMLGYDELHMYDVYVPLVERKNEKVPFDEGVELMLKGLAPLGDEYIENVKKGVEERWIDIYENEGKTSGAYSFGSYDSKPYIMLNYTDTLKDVFTLVHEMGHSMHSFYTRKTQPYVYGGHSIFTAEVASTVNESLLIHYLLSNSQNDEERKYLINTHIEDFRTTLFRQTMFAEFEKMSHEIVEQDGVLTSERLSEDYFALNKKYFGPSVVNDDRIAMEWSRIPHFYRAFYVYKYATGYSAATAITKKLLEGGNDERDAYLEFLKSGDSDDPIELLKIAGVDMSRPDPVESAMQAFAALVEKMEQLV